jgi:hypothetical protein
VLNKRGHVAWLLPYDLYRCIPKDAGTMLLRPLFGSYKVFECLAYSPNAGAAFTGSAKELHNAIRQNG